MEEDKKVSIPNSPQSGIGCLKKEYCIRLKEFGFNWDEEKGAYVITDKGIDYRLYLSDKKASLRVTYGGYAGMPIFTGMIVDDIQDLNYLLKNAAATIPTFLSDFKTEI